MDYVWEDFCGIANQPVPLGDVGPRVPEAQPYRDKTAVS